MYHAIIPRQPGWRNVDLDAVYQDDFERHLRSLKRRFSVLHPEEWADVVAADRPLPRRSVLITIDDGFQNLIDHAVPVAEAANVVPLAFVSTGHLDRARWLWFARICASHLLGGADLRRRAGSLSRMRLEEIEAVLVEWNAPARSNGSPLCRLLFDGADTALLERCVRKGALCLGGHTVRHPNLPRESPEVCRSEIIENKIQLERIAGGPVRLFAYPSGHVNEEAARHVRDAGFVGAFSILPPERSFPAALGAFHVPRTGIQASGPVAFRMKCAGIDYWRWKFGLLA